MSTRNFSFSVGEYYHIYNRGTDKRDIFLDNSDRDRFIKLLFVANGTNPFVFRDFPIGLPYVEFDRGQSIVDIGAYVLMPNHFHILIKETTQNGISIFMNKVLTSYTMYFNKKYKRTGRLFEGVFKGRHADSDEYLKYLFSYIHLNPVKLIDPKWKENGISNKNEAKAYLNSYLYSSYLDYLGSDRREAKILNKNAFPGYFSDLADFESCVDEWLSFNSLRTT
ncbi:MAG: transposase [Candidatus Nomurabacteria bacterium]|nr:transposase [Candidatus Nomurabacteria bacterium]